ncbi:hypothetical protein BC829DRAFT_381496 [Chytridium lagenaria]|nr:hypothetical protein BC829DRAFT_381496 [Chytridium lagenaria]
MTVLSGASGAGKLIRASQSFSTSLAAHAPDPSRLFSNPSSTPPSPSPSSRYGSSKPYLPRFSCPTGPLIRTLHIHRLSTLTDALLIPCLRACPSLIHLELYACDQSRRRIHHDCRKKLSTPPASHCTSRGTVFETLGDLGCEILSAYHGRCTLFTRDLVYRLDRVWSHRHRTFGFIAGWSGPVLKKRRVVEVVNVEVATGPTVLLAPAAEGVLGDGRTTIIAEECTQLRVLEIKGCQQVRSLNPLCRMTARGVRIECSPELKKKINEAMDITKNAS